MMASSTFTSLGLLALMSVKSFAAPTGPALVAARASPVCDDPNASWDDKSLANCPICVNPEGMTQEIFNKYCLLVGPAWLHEIEDVLWRRSHTPVEPGAQDEEAHVVSRSPSARPQDEYHLPDDFKDSGVLALGHGLANSVWKILPRALEKVHDGDWDSVRLDELTPHTKLYQQESDLEVRDTESTASLQDQTALKFALPPGSDPLAIPVDPLLQPIEPYPLPIEPNPLIRPIKPWPLPVSPSPRPTVPRPKPFVPEPIVPGYPIVELPDEASPILTKDDGIHDTKERRNENDLNLAIPADLIPSNENLPVPDTDPGLIRTLPVIVDPEEALSTLPVPVEVDPSEEMQSNKDWRFGPLIWNRPYGGPILPRANRDGEWRVKPSQVDDTVSDRLNLVHNMFIAETHFPAGGIFRREEKSSVSDPHEPLPAILPQPDKARTPQPSSDDEDDVVAKGPARFPGFKPLMLIAETHFPEIGIFRRENAAPEATPAPSKQNDDGASDDLHLERRSYPSQGEDHSNSQYRQEGSSENNMYDKDPMDIVAKVETHQLADGLYRRGPAPSKEDFLSQTDELTEIQDKKLKADDDRKDKGRIAEQLEEKNCVYCTNKREASKAPPKKSVPTNEDSSILEADELLEQSAAASKEATVDAVVIHQPAPGIFRRERWGEPASYEESPSMEGSNHPKNHKESSPSPESILLEAQNNIMVTHQPADKIYRRGRAQSMQDDSYSPPTNFDSEHSQPMISADTVILRPVNEIFRRKSSAWPTIDTDYDKLTVDWRDFLGPGPQIVPGPYVGKRNSKFSKQEDTETVQRGPADPTTPTEDLKFENPGHDLEDRSAQPVPPPEFFEDGFWPFGRRLLATPDSIITKRSHNHNDKTGDAGTSARRVKPFRDTPDAHFPFDIVIGVNKRAVPDDKVEQRRDASPVPPPEFFEDHSWPFSSASPSEQRKTSDIAVPEDKPWREPSAEVNDLLRRDGEEALINNVLTSLERFNNPCNDPEARAHMLANGVFELNCRSKARRRNEDLAKRQEDETQDWYEDLNTSPDEPFLHVKHAKVYRRQPTHEKWDEKKEYTDKRSPAVGLDRREYAYEDFGELARKIYLSGVPAYSHIPTDTVWHKGKRLEHVDRRWDVDDTQLPDDTESTYEGESPYEGESSYETESPYETDTIGDYISRDGPIRVCGQYGNCWEVTDGNLLSGLNELAGPAQALTPSSSVYVRSESEDYLTWLKTKGTKTCFSAQGGEWCTYSPPSTEVPAIAHERADTVDRREEDLEKRQALPDQVYDQLNSEQESPSRVWRYARRDDSATATKVGQFATPLPAPQDDTITVLTPEQACEKEGMSLSAIVQCYIDLGAAEMPQTWSTPARVHELANSVFLNIDPRDLPPTATINKRQGLDMAKTNMLEQRSPDNNLLGSGDSVAAASDPSVTSAGSDNSQPDQQDSNYLPIPKHVWLPAVIHEESGFVHKRQNSKPKARSSSESTDGSSASTTIEHLERRQENIISNTNPGSDNSYPEVAQPDTWSVLPSWMHDLTSAVYRRFAGPVSSKTNLGDKRSLVTLPDEPMTVLTPEEACGKESMSFEESLQCFSDHGVDILPYIFGIPPDTPDVHVAMGQVFGIGKRQAGYSSGSGSAPAGSASAENVYGGAPAFDYAQWPAPPEYDPSLPPKTPFVHLLRDKVLINSRSADIDLQTLRAKLENPGVPLAHPLSQTLHRRDTYEEVMEALKAAIERARMMQAISNDLANNLPTAPDSLTQPDSLTSPELLTTPISPFATTSVQRRDLYETFMAALNAAIDRTRTMPTSDNEEANTLNTEPSTLTTPETSTDPEALTKPISPFGSLPLQRRSTYDAFIAALNAAIARARTLGTANNDPASTLDTSSDDTLTVADGQTKPISPFASVPVSRRGLRSGIIPTTGASLHPFVDTVYDGDDQEPELRQRRALPATEDPKESARLGKAVDDAYGEKQAPKTVLSRQLLPTEDLLPGAEDGQTAEYVEDEVQHSETDTYDEPQQTAMDGMNPPQTNEQSDEYDLMQQAKNILSMMPDFSWKKLKARNWLDGLTDLRPVSKGLYPAQEVTRRSPQSVWPDTFNTNGDTAFVHSLASLVQVLEGEDKPAWMEPGFFDDLADSEAEPSTAPLSDPIISILNGDPSYSIFDSENSSASPRVRRAASQDDDEDTGRKGSTATAMRPTDTVMEVFFSKKHGSKDRRDEYDGDEESSLAEQMALEDDPNDREPRVMWLADSVRGLNARKEHDASDRPSGGDSDGDSESDKKAYDRVVSGKQSDGAAGKGRRQMRRGWRL